MGRLTPFLILLLFLVSCGGGNEESRGKKESSKKPEPVYLYGICIDSLDVKEDHVKKNEFLGSILSREGVSQKTIHYIDKNNRDVFDVRKIKVGNKYAFLMSRDSVPQAKYWIYEIDRTEIMLSFS